MSWEVRADGRELFARYDDRGPVYLLSPDGELSEQFRGLDIVEPMVPLDDAVSETLELIKDVPLSKAARVALAEKLGVEFEDVGTAPARKAKEKSA